MKAIDDYPNHNRYKDGKNKICKQCYNIYLTDYRRRNKDKVRRTQRIYYLKNKETILKRQKDKYHQNKRNNNG